MENKKKRTIDLTFQITSTQIRILSLLDFKFIRNVASNLPMQFFIRLFNFIYTFRMFLYVVKNYIEVNDSSTFGIFFYLTLNLP